MLKLLKAWWPTLIVFGVILYSTLNSDPVPELDMGLFPHADKLIHAIMFGGFAGAMAFDWQRSHKSNRVSSGLMLLFCAISALTGALDEVAQLTLTDTRSADILDWLADCLGISVAFFAAPPAVSAVLKLKKDK